MRVVIVGAGQVGFAVAARLTREHHDVVVVDTDAAHLADVEHRLDVGTVQGTGCSPVVLRRAGIDQARMVIAVTDSDEVNLLACLVTGRIAPEAVRVARVRDPEYHEDPDLFRSEPFSVHAVINPEEEAAKRLVRTLGAPGAMDVVHLGNGKAVLMALLIDDASPLAGKTLVDIGPLQTVPMRVVCIDRRGAVTIPQGSDRILAGDVAYLLCGAADVEPVLLMAGKHIQQVRSVIVFGGGNVARYLGEQLDERGVGVKLLFDEPEACTKCAQILPHALVIQGEGTDAQLLRDEGIAHTDAFIACSRDDEQNVPAALLAKSLGARIAMLVTSSATFERLAPAIGIDAVTSPQSAVVGSILQFVRRGRVLGVSALWSLDAEVMEFQATPRSGLVNRPLRELRVPKGTIVLAVQHDGEITIATGKTTIQPGDRVVVMAREEAVAKLEKLFA